MLEALFENANLYKGLEDRVAERTKEVIHQKSKLKNHTKTPFTK